MSYRVEIVCDDCAVTITGIQTEARMSFVRRLDADASSLGARKVIPASGWSAHYCLRCAAKRIKKHDPLLTAG